MLREIRYYLLLVLSLPVLLSCNSEGNQENSESEKAFTEYRDVVTEFEESSLSEVELRAMRDSNFDSTTWANITSEKEEEYEQKRQALDQNMEAYTPERQQEIEDLENRYNTAVEKRQQEYEEASYRYTLRQQLLGLEIEEDDLSDIQPAEIDDTYQRFVENVAEGAEEFDTRDWNLVEGWWSSLSSRYRSLEAELDQQAQTAITQAQARYKEIRQQYASVE